MLGFFVSSTRCMQAGSARPMQVQARRSRRQNAKVVRKSSQPKNRSKINEKSSKIDEESTKIRCWAVLGAPSRFRNAPGHAGDVSRTARNRLVANLGTPRACQSRSGDVKKRARADPETLSDDPGALSKRVQRKDHSRTRLRHDFSTFLCCRAKARSLKFVRPRSVS